MNFEDQVAHFNRAFGLPVEDAPKLFIDHKNRVSALGQLQRFKKILQDELSEVDDIITVLTTGQYANQLDVLVPLADWLGDMQVYCASEMLKWGIPIQATLDCIMEAQTSKLVNGVPLVVDGKVQKGPDYCAPEPRIHALLKEMIHEHYQRS